MAKAVLAAGHRVVATSRSLQKTPDAVAEITSTHNGAWLPLDVTSADFEQQVAACVAHFGRIDVLINNAGYGIGGALEDLSLEDTRSQFETNFFGPVRAMKAVIPTFREQGSGTIINVSSTEGFSAAPGIGMYAASKFALEAITESLQGELAPFGIRILLVEPGGMRTSFVEPEKRKNIAPLSEAYKNTPAEMVLNYVQSSHGAQMLDPQRAATRIVEAVTSGGEGWPQKRETYLRLPLGRECFDKGKAKALDMLANFEAMERVSLSADFD